MRLNVNGEVSYIYLVSEHIFGFPRTRASTEKKVGGFVQFSLKKIIFRFNILRRIKY